VVNLTGILSRKVQTFEDVQAMAPPISPRRQPPPGCVRWSCLAIGADLESESAYAVTKAEGETGRARGVSQRGDPAPLDHLRARGWLLQQVRRNGASLAALPLVGGGHTLFQPIFVGDVAQAILVALSRQDGRTYELGGPSSYSFKELMQLILRETGRNRALIPNALRARFLEGGLLQLLPNPILTWTRCAC